MPQGGVAELRRIGNGCGWGTHDAPAIPKEVALDHRVGSSDRRLGRVHRLNCHPGIDSRLNQQATVRCPRRSR